MIITQKISDIFNGLFSAQTFWHRFFLTYLQMWWCERPPTTRPSANRRLCNVCTCHFMQLVTLVYISVCHFIYLHACIIQHAVCVCHFMHPVTRLHFSVGDRRCSTHKYILCKTLAKKAKDMAVLNFKVWKLYETVMGQLIIIICII